MTVEIIVAILILSHLGAFIWGANYGRAVAARRIKESLSVDEDGNFEEMY